MSVIGSYLSGREIPSRCHAFRGEFAVLSACHISHEQLGSHPQRAFKF